MVPSKLVHLFFLLSPIWLIIDSINGFFLANGTAIPLSPLYKIIIMFVASIGLASFKKGLIIILSTYLYVGLLFLHLVLNIKTPLIGATINHLFRFILIILIYSYTIFFIQNGYHEYFYNKISKVFNINIYVLMANIIIGLAGLGYSAYSEGLGYRGFFYAGNELSGLIIILFSFFLYQTGEKYSYKSKAFIKAGFLCLVTAALLGTKTGLLSVILSLIIIPNLSISRKKLLKIAIPTLCFLSILIYVLYIALDSLGLMNRWIYFYEQGGLSQLLLSGRYDFWIAEKHRFLEADNIWIRILGLGASNNKSIEMDPLDTLLMYGYVGLIITYGFYFYLLIKSFRYRKKTKIAYLVFYVNVMLLSASTFAGHILYSGMASLFIALINALIYIPDYFLYKFNKNEAT